MQKILSYVVFLCMVTGYACTGYQSHEESLQRAQEQLKIEAQAETVLGVHFSYASEAMYTDLQIFAHEAWIAEELPVFLEEYAWVTSVHLSDSSQSRMLVFSNEPVIVDQIGQKIYGNGAAHYVIFSEGGHACRTENAGGEHTVTVPVAITYFTSLPISEIPKRKILSAWQSSQDFYLAKNH